MGGGGGRWIHDEIKADLSKSREDAKKASYNTSVSEYLNGILRSSNERDAPLISQRLDQIAQSVVDLNGGELFKFNYGGSVAKHTYVDGLSDIDVLLPVNGSSIEEKTPEAIRRALARRIEDRVPNVVSVRLGAMAVSVEFSDAMEIQILPALKDEGGLSVPAADRAGWSQINPAKFTRALTKANERLGNKLVPTIKLVKAINANLPDSAQLTGYHVESLAIEAFRSYDGERTHKVMLAHFFSAAKELVLRPIVDRTGQSVHVDEYLGAKDSRERKLASSLLDRIARRINFAEVTSDQTKWRELFE